MDLSPSNSQGPEYFRVYSDREHAPGTFVWSPTMDLLAVLSTSEELAVSVHRLLPDDDEPHLFHEQLPFAASAVTWHPSGRELAVGDVHGNVFILTAEPEDERRLHEVQKLHGSGVASLQWVAFGRNFEDSSRLPSSFYSYAKLPALHARDVSQPSSLLASLSASGHISFLVDGWLPIADIRLPKSEESTYVDLAFHPNSTEVVALANDNIHPHEYFVFVSDTSSLAKAQAAILLTAEVERDALQVLKQLHSLNEQCTRLLASIHEEFAAKFDVMDVAELVGANPKAALKRIDESFSLAKLQKWEKRLYELLDELLTTSLVTKLPAEVVKNQVRTLAGTVKIKYHAYKEVCRIIGEVVTRVDGLETSEFAYLRECAEVHAFAHIGTDEVKSSIKHAEAAIHQVLAAEREKNSATIKMSAGFKISGASVRPSLAWKTPCTPSTAFVLEILWVSGDDQSCLHVVRLDEATSEQGERQAHKVVLDMSDTSKWLRFTTYRDELCVCVGNDSGSSVCLVNVDCVRPVGNLVNISAVDPYRISVEELGGDNVKAQQLPMGFEMVTGLAVSSSRRLASVFGCNRLITIDLEPEDE